MSSILVRKEEEKASGEKTLSSRRPYKEGVERCQELVARKLLKLPEPGKGLGRFCTAGFGGKCCRPSALIPEISLSLHWSSSPEFGSYVTVM
jgi:hypothetical protein